MATERVQRRIDRLLDQIEEAADQQNWERERALAEEVLALDPDNQDAQTFLVAAERSLSRTSDRSAQEAFNLVAAVGEGGGLVWNVVWRGWRL